MRCYSSVMITVVTAATQNKLDHLLNLRKTLQMYAPGASHLIVTVGEEPWEPWEGAFSSLGRKAEQGARPSKKRKR